jgi:hydrogenase-4 component F
MALLGILIPVAGALVAFLWPTDRGRVLWLPVIGGLHLAITLAAVARPPVLDPAWWLAIDPPGRLVLLLVSTLFAVLSVYAVGYLRARAERPNRVFCACLLVFLGTMTFITWARHLGLMWVAVEASTLASAPLLYFNRNARSLEATWKYLMVGSVGIALALLGSLFMGYAAAQAGREPSLLFDDLVAGAPGFSKVWLHAAFVLLAVGYGTKMGLAPMHTWKPDAYGEAPGLVGALMAGAMTSCAFLALLRVYRVLAAAGEAEFAGRILVFLGLFSMALAGVFMVRQRDFKRMLAYSSVEHMGVLVLGLGLGGAGVFGALLHMVNNGVIKGVLFLSAGNIHRAYGSKHAEEVTGAMRRVPWSGALFLVGFIAVTGSPPFGSFISEFTVVAAAMEQRRFGVAAAALVLLLVVFLGMGATVLGVVQGEVSAAGRETAPGSGFRDSLLMVAPLLLLVGISLVMGLAMPPAIQRLVREAAAYVGGAP